MFKRLATALAGLSLVAGLAASTPALAAKHYFEGKVVDRNGKPLDRAMVSVKPGDVQLVTDREGRFLIDYLRDDSGDRVKLKKKTTYTVEVFKPGFHMKSVSLEYKRGAVILEPLTLVEETIEVRDDGKELDPALYRTETNSSGANYEGQ
jgi:hypothetical protein